MNYNNDSYKKDLPYLAAAKKHQDDEAFTYLFDKYFNIVLAHITKLFKNVRQNVLEDVAIEVIEGWFFDIDNDWDADKIGLYLCTQARSNVIKIIRYKTYHQDFSSLNTDDSDSVDKFINLLCYYNIAGTDYNSDLAKLTFRLKKKLDKHIGDLSDRDYTIITSYLDGLNKKEVESVLGCSINHHDAIQVAFKHLREAVFDNRNSIFDKQKKLYLKSDAKFKHPEVMEMYYKQNLKIRTISDVLNKKYDIVKGWIKRDRELIAA